MTEAKMQRELSLTCGSAAEGVTGGGQQRPTMRNNAESRQTPHERRWGTLRNGNPGGDLRNVPKCGAKTRAGTPCQCPAMSNGRCRIHGGLSTGAKTAAGLARISAAVLKNGRYTKEEKAKKERRAYVAGLVRWAKAATRKMYRKPRRV